MMQLRYAIILFILLVVVALNIKCKTDSDSKVVESNTQEYASLDSTTGYVGMENCKSCHQSIYDSFIQTGMGQSFDVASRKKSSAQFNDHDPVYDRFNDFYYQPFWENDSMKIKEYRLEGGDTIYKRVETVSYIVGSGQHTNSHIMNTFGYLNQMPLTFYTQKGTWDLPPGFENGGNSRFSRIIGLECMSCHNAYPDFIQGSENRYDFVANGINCERCHGPGEKHIKEKMAGNIVDVVNNIDYTIVNPAKLPIDLQLDVCQRCHIQGNAVLKEGKSFFDFKPGMHLSEVMDVYMPVYKGRENEHIMASHVERMKLSKCFTASLPDQSQSNNLGLRPYKNALTCVTCHNPHVSVQNTDKEHFNNACKSCHTENKSMCSENQKVLKSSNFNCINCHMPVSGATDIPHVSVHDHLIRIPVEDNEINKIKEFVGINCINNKKADDISIAKAYVAYFEKFNFGIEVLDSAKKYLSIENKQDLIANFKILIHIYFLEENYKEVVSIIRKVPSKEFNQFKSSLGNFDAWTAYRIGESLAFTDDPIMASDFFGKAYSLAPSVPQFANKFATSLIQINELFHAKSILERSTRQYSKFPPTLSNLGYLVLVMENNTERANILYDNALALDPDYEQALINKAGLLMSMRNFSEAKSLLEKYMIRKPQSTAAAGLLTQLNTISEQ